MDYISIFADIRRAAGVSFGLDQAGELAKMTRTVTSRRSPESATQALVLLLAADVLITAAETSCEAGQFFIVPSLTCSGSCPCTPWVGRDGSTISSNELYWVDEYRNNAQCEWKISGQNPQVTFDSFSLEGVSKELFEFPESHHDDWVAIFECFEAECNNFGEGAVLYGEHEPGKLYESSTSHLLVYISSSATGSGCGFTATVSGEPSRCVPCKVGTYTAVIDASECTACPANAVSAEGSTAFSSCVCHPGYLGDAEVGKDCVPCEAGTYMDVSGSAT